MKTEVYSWRLDPELKAALERSAHSQGSSVAGLLETIVRGWLEHDGSAGDDAEEQRRLHTAARATFGTLQSGDELLAEEAGGRLRRKLRERYAADRAG